MVIECCVINTLPFLFIVAFMLQQWLLGVALCVLHCLSCSLLRVCCSNGYWVLLYAYVQCLSCAPAAGVYSAVRAVQGNFSVSSVNYLSSHQRTPCLYAAIVSSCSAPVWAACHIFGAATVNVLLSAQWVWSISVMHTNLLPVVHFWK